MKTKALVFSLFLITLFGCDQIGDLLSRKVSTTLTVNHTFTVTTQNQATKSGGSTAVTYVFSTSKDLSLSDNTDLNDLINKIRSISVNSATAQFLNLQANQVILTLSVKADGTEVFTKTNITSSNSAFTPDISAANLEYIASRLMANKKIIVTISGTTNSSAMTFGSNLGFEVEVDVKLL